MLSFAARVAQSNETTVQQPWRDEGLTVPAKRRKKVASVSTGPSVEATAAKMAWNIAKRMIRGSLIRRLMVGVFKITSTVDARIRGSLPSPVDRSITAVDVIQAAAEVVEDRGAPQMLCCAIGACVHFS